MPDFFLSYSRKDIDFMCRVRDDLRAAGFDVWTDENLTPGTPSWTQSIDAAIRGSKALVIVLSPDSRVSEWVDKELALAQILHLPIYPIMTRGDDATSIPFRLQNTQYADARTNQESGLGKLRQTLNNAFHPQPPSAPAKRAGEFIVSRTGAADFRTINDALKNVPEGAVIRVRPGLYRESLILNQAVEMIGDGNRGDVVIEGSTTSVMTMNTDYAVVRNVTLRLQSSAAQTKAFAVELPTGRLVLEDCDMTSNSLSCVVISNSADPILRRCYIHDGKEVGVLVENNGAGLIEECDIFANSLSGIAIKDGSKITVRQCRIYDNGETGILCFSQGAGLIERCDIYRNKFSNIQIKEDSNPTVRQCHIHDGKENGILVSKNGVGLVENCEIYANTLYGIEIRKGGNPTVRFCNINRNQQFAIWSHDEGLGSILNCDLTGNVRGAWNADSTSSMTKSGNKE